MVEAPTVVPVPHLTMPAVTLFCRCSGLPSATTHSPTRRLADRPAGRRGRRPGGNHLQWLEHAGGPCPVHTHVLLAADPPCLEPHMCDSPATSRGAWSQQGHSLPQGPCAPARAHAPSLRRAAFSARQPAGSPSLAVGSGLSDSIRSTARSETVS